MQRYVFSKLKWQFSVDNLTDAWVSENLENAINRYYRKWLHFPVSDNITHLSLPKNKLVLNIKTLKEIYVECKVTVGQTLKLSRNEEVKKVNTDCLINSIDITENISSEARRKVYYQKKRKKTI